MHSLLAFQLFEKKFERSI